MTEGKNRYTNPWYLATYLEMEWSDYLLDSAVWPEQHTPPVHPLFYQRVAETADDWCKTYAVTVNTYCDVGGSIGRMVYEIVTRLPSLEEALLAEPSSQFCDWARRILFGHDRPRYIPVVDELHDPSYCAVHSWPPAIAQSDRPRIEVCEVTADQIPRPRGHFDLVTCLNVLDCVEQPKRLMEDLAQIVRPGGLLIIGSPMDFETQFTPDETAWVSDIRGLCSRERWEVLETTNVPYEVRPYARKRIHYSTQITLGRRL